MDLSIIIPVYNTNINILKRCIESIISLKSINYEIIIIDDGSSTENRNLYINYVNDLSNTDISIYHKENGGVSSARNYGIKLSKGSFIMFVDSDDIIYSDVLNYNSELVKYDLVFYNRVYVIKDRIKENKGFENDTGEINYKTIMEKFIKSNNFFYGPVAKLYKKEFLLKNNIFFREDMIQGEDAEFNLSILECMPRIYYIDKNLYGYFYSMDTSNARFEKNSLTIIRNSYFLFKRKEQLINQFSLNTNLIIINKSLYINNAYNHCLRLVRIKNTNEQLNLICDYLHSISKEGLKFKDKIKFYVIYNKKTMILKSMSILRNIYINYIKERN